MKSGGGRRKVTVTKTLFLGVSEALDGEKTESFSRLVVAVFRCCGISHVTYSPRVIFRRGRECDGEAYIMFTGTADQKGGDKSGDRLIK